MFQNVYLGTQARSGHDDVHRTIHGLFDFYLEDPSRIPADDVAGDDLQRVTDYVAGMTDRYAMSTFAGL
jgi:dGTPase